MGISRAELFRKLGVTQEGPNLDKFTHRAYVTLEDRIWRENLESSPHGRPWHTSFHASSFSGDEKACGRKMLYTMLDVPSPEPFSPKLRATADIGQQVEYQIVYRWGLMGYTIAGSVPLWDGAEHVQLGLKDTGTWLTGSIDAVLGLPDWQWVLPVDVKSKAHNVIEEMRVGAREYEPKHYGQVQAYIYLCGLHYEEMGWKEMGFLPPIGACIYYASRQDPRTTHSFYVDRNDLFIDRGIALLQKQQEAFLAGQLTERPKEWRWTEDPCKWCDYKKHVCKPDYTAKNLNLRESAAVGFTSSLRKAYDVDQTIQEVLNRWQ